MPVKHFIIDPTIKSVGKDGIELIEKEKVERRGTHIDSHERRNNELMGEDDSLVHVAGRIVIKINLQGKNSHTFQNGLTIRREREFNDFNRRQSQPVNGYVISAEYIPKGCEVLISHNALHDSNRIFNSKNGRENSTDIRYFSIPEYECFAWRDMNGELFPMKNYEFALRVYKPYKGRISFITPSLVKNTLYITTGKLKGKVVHTLLASDYEIVYQGTDGREARVIRIRHSEDENFDREEITAISDELTELVQKGELIVGLEPDTAKPIKN